MTPEAAQAMWSGAWRQVLDLYAEWFERQLADAEAIFARLADWQPEPGQETVTIPVVRD